MNSVLNREFWCSEILNRIASLKFKEEPQRLTFKTAERFRQNETKRALSSFSCRVWTVISRLPALCLKSNLLKSMKIRVHCEEIREKEIWDHKGLLIRNIYKRRCFVRHSKTELARPKLGRPTDCGTFAEIFRLELPVSESVCASKFELR